VCVGDPVGGEVGLRVGDPVGGEVGVLVGVPVGGEVGYPVGPCLPIAGKGSILHILFPKVYSQTILPV